MRKQVNIENGFAISRRLSMGNIERKIEKINKQKIQFFTPISTFINTFFLGLFK